jgi:hypothetical protein
VLAGVVRGLGPRAHLVTIAGADHGLEVPRRAGIDPFAIAADEIARWIGALPPTAVP